MTQGERISFLVGVLAFLLSAGYVTWTLDVEGEPPEVCEAAADGRWEEILAQPLSEIGPDPARRDAAECRCWALLATQRRDECIDLMGRLLLAPEARDWVPDPLLSGLGARRLRDLGRGERAVFFLERAVTRYPNDLTLLGLWVAARADREGEDAVLAELAATLRPMRDHALRIVLAGVRRQRGEHQEALTLLVAPAPSRRSPLRDPWFDALTASRAALGDLPGVQQGFAAWRNAGASEDSVRARYALRLSLSQLRDPEKSFRALLREAIDEGWAREEPETDRLLYERLIAHLLADGETAEALDVFDAASRTHLLRGITRSQIEREGALRGESGAAATPGSLRFTAPAGFEGASISLSRGVTAPPDADYETLVFDGDGTLRFERPPAAWPERWVLRDVDGRVRASGRRWVRAGVEDVIEPRIETPVPAKPAPTPVERAVRPALPKAGLGAPGDGRRRLIAVVLDGADWRLVQYLRARGELPTMSRLFARGWRAVLASDPPLTAAAMEALVWPERGRPASVLGWAHQMGVELAGLEGVGRNPLAFLSVALPTSANLFEAVGAGDHVAANMLFSHGMIDGGTHAEVIGPHGERRPSLRSRAARALRPAEQERFPGLLADPRARPQVESIAAEMDAARAVATRGEVDFLFLRIEALDLLTHAYFAALVEDGQDNGQSTLLEVYRYLDQRLAELWSALDADDVLVVMSDHGIRTSMQHERDAIFVAVGGGLPHGRAPAMPALVGVPRTFADWLGIETAWPDHGVGPTAVAAPAR